MSADAKYAQSTPCVRIYAGLAGDTDPGRFLSSGLYRNVGFAGDWEPLTGKFTLPVQVRAILTNPARPGWIVIGTQLGIFRSDDYGDHWDKLSAPAPGLAVWSLTCLPGSETTLLAGYEPGVILRSDDDGLSWRELRFNAEFPSITQGSDVPKRVTSIGTDPLDRNTLYATFEVGGLMRSQDGGANWCSVIDGLYVTDDAVDVHQVHLNPQGGGVIILATRVGVFRSDDHGAHWRKLAVPPTSPRGVYCRSIAAAPDDPKTLYLGAGEAFEGDFGALFVSRDGGESWTAAQHGAKLKSTVWAVATDARQPDYVYFSSKYGDVLRSKDRGRNWSAHPLPHGVGHVFSLAIG